MSGWVGLIRPPNATNQRATAVDLNFKIDGAGRSVALVCSPAMKCLLIFYVLYDGPDGECEEFGIEKEFDFAIRPMIGDELTVCGDSPFHVAAVAYDVDEATIEVRFNRGPRIESVQRWIDSGFSLHDIGGSVPSHLVW